MSKLQLNVAVLSCVLLSGCSTIGQLEVLNDISPATKRLRQASAVASSVDAIVTGRSQPTSVTPNLAYGTAAQLPYHIKSGRPATAAAEIINVMRH